MIGKMLCSLISFLFLSLTVCGSDMERLAIPAKGEWRVPVENVEGYLVDCYGAFKISIPNKPVSTVVITNLSDGTLEISVTKSSFWKSITISDIMSHSPRIKVEIPRVSGPSVVAGVDVGAVANIRFE